MSVITIIKCGIGGNCHLTYSKLTNLKKPTSGIILVYFLSSSQFSSSLPILKTPENPLCFHFPPSRKKHSKWQMTLCSSIYSGYFYSASSSPLTLRGAPNYSIHTVSELTCRSVTGNCEWRSREGVPEVPYVVASVGLEPVTLWTEVTELTTEPGPRLTC